MNDRESFQEHLRKRAMEKEMTEVNLEENNIDNEENLDIVENVGEKKKGVYMI